MTYFFDSSARVKLYHVELGSPQVGQIFDEPDRRIIISRLAGVEFNSAVALRTRTGQLNPTAAAGLRLRFFDHITSGAILLVSVNEHHYAGAERLIVQYGDKKSLRTLDALQLAVVLEAQTRIGLDAFAVADATLAAIARAEGVFVVDPGP